MRLTNIGNRVSWGIQIQIKFSWWKSQLTEGERMPVVNDADLLLVVVTSILCCRYKDEIIKMTCEFTNLFCDPVEKNKIFMVSKRTG